MKRKRLIQPLLPLVALLTYQTQGQMEFPGYKQPWPKATPESQGMSTELLRNAKSLMTDDQETKFSKMDMIVIRNGKDVWHYGNPYEQYVGAQYQKDWASCGRSIMTTLYGMLFKENNTGTEVMDISVKDAFNSHKGKEMDAEIKVKHLLSYTSCAMPPGSGWEYACNYFMMVKILRDVDGRPPGWRIDELAKKIRADWQTYEIYFHEQGVPFYSFQATPSEAARWGYLWLNKGNWDGITVVDPEFVEYSVKPIKSPLGGYAHSNEGLQIHLNYNGMWGNSIPKDAYAAFGAGGRIIFVCPSLNLVVASITTPGAYSKVEINGEVHRDIGNLIAPIIKAIR